MSVLMGCNQNDLAEDSVQAENNTVINEGDVYVTEYVPKPYISPKKRRLVTRIAYIIFTSSFVYLIVGPWVGWNCVAVRRTLFTVWSTVAFVQLPLGKTILKFAPSRKVGKWQMMMYSMVPWRSLSRSWGRIAAIPIPELARPYVYGAYSKLFGVDTEEMEKPLRHYTNMTDFFTRKLKVNARVIDTCGLLVSPCDGVVVQCGPIYDKYIKKVKGLDYCIKSFLGFEPNKSSSRTVKCLYQCVLYLAPGDYHRFHSPCDWVALQRRHFKGKLLSVAPKLARWMPNLLAINERVAYVGKWEYGFFSYTAVGATNVGSIRVHNDPTLATNKFRSNSDVNYKRFDEEYKLSRGEEAGLFSMGSTIVLIFEAPQNFHFTCHENDRIKVGNCIGGLDCLYSSPPSPDSLSSDEGNELSDIY